MTDDRSDGHDSPEPEREPGHADVSALLAALAADAPPLPDDVAARLDDTLAGLVAARSDAGAGTGTGTDEGGVVVPLAGPRRRPGRRWGPRLLAAATVAAVVGGVGVSLHAMAGQGSGSGFASGSSGSESAQRPTAGNGARPGATAASASAALPRLTIGHFHRDAARLLGSPTAYDTARSPAPSAPAAGSGSAPAAGRLDSHRAAGRRTSGAAGKDLRALLQGCTPPRAPTSAGVVAARLDGRPATLVLRSLPHGRLRVTAWSCAGDSVLAATTVRR